MSLRLGATAAAALCLATAAPARATTVADLVVHCAPHVAPRTALAIISVESGGRWWAVNDNDRATPTLGSPAAAIAYVQRRLAEDPQASIDVGMTQLNSTHLAALRLSVVEAFEPCTNVAMGMGVLQDGWTRAVRRYGYTRLALHKAFEAYNGGPGSWDSRRPKLRAKVERYADEVWNAAASLEVPSTATAAVDVRKAPPDGVVVRRGVADDAVRVHVEEEPR